MKRYLKVLLLAAVAAGVTACNLDDLPAENTENSDKVGYLQIGDVAVVADAENSSIGDEPDFTRAETRATTEADDNYFIEIFKSDNTLVWSGTYATAKSLYSATDTSKKGIALEPGSYSVYAYQTQTKTPENGVAENDPYYAGKSDVEIVKNQTATVKVTCHLANIRTTVEMSADLKKMFKGYESADADYEANRLKTVVTIGTELGDEKETSNSYTFERDASHPQEQTVDGQTTVVGGPIVYFSDVAGASSTSGNTMKISLSGMFYTGDPVDIYNDNPNADKWKFVKMDKTVTGVKAGQWRKISVDIDHNTTGNVSFIFTIESYVYDDQIEVPTTQTFTTLSFYEESIPEDDYNDPLAPQVTIDGNAADNMNYSIDASKYNPDASTETNIAWTSYLKAIITPQGTSAVEALRIELKSENASLLTAMEDKGFADGTILLRPTPTTGASEYLNVAADGKSITLTTAGMSALFKYQGTHIFRVHTQSDDGHQGFGDITVTVSEGGAMGDGPTVVWMKDGVDVIDQWHNLTSAENYPTEITITSDTGITGMTVDISAKKLTPEELDGFGLAQHMDLLDPGSGKTESGLRSLGFIPTESGDSATAFAFDNYRMYYPGEIAQLPAGVDEKFANNRIPEVAQSPLYGRKEVTFSVTNFTGLLWALYAGESDNAVFTLKVTHAGGTTVKQVKFKINPTE